MRPGRLIAVVGPSGVGKDSVMQALAAASARLVLARRVIDRPADAGGEDHVAATPEAFDALVAEGALALWWRAHGQRYGIPRAVREDLAEGRDVLANLSRAELGRAAEIFPRFRVLHLTATPATLRARLAARGREDAAGIEARLARPAPPLPPGLPVIEIANDGPLDRTVATALARLDDDDTLPTRILIEDHP